MWMVTLLVLAGYIGIPVDSSGRVGDHRRGALPRAAGYLSNLGRWYRGHGCPKPFAVGLWDAAGLLLVLVAEIGLVYTRLKTIDNKIIFVPNGEFPVRKITNYNSQDRRRVDLSFAVSYEDDPERVKQGHTEGGRRAHPKALFTPEPLSAPQRWGQQRELYPEGLNRQANGGLLGALWYDLLEQVRAAFGLNGIGLT